MNSQLKLTRVLVPYVTLSPAARKGADGQCRSATDTAWQVYMLLPEAIAGVNAQDGTKIGDQDFLAAC